MDPAFIRQILLISETCVFFYLTLWIFIFFYSYLKIDINKKKNISKD